MPTVMVLRQKNLASAMLRSPLKLGLIVFWIALFYPLVLLVYLLGKNNWRDRLMQFVSAGLTRICEVRLHVSSEPTDKRPLVLVSNHISYMDTVILAGIMPVCFTPKLDVASWPAIGSICKICGCVFVERTPGKIQQTREVLKHTLSNRVVCLYPEATTGNGLEMHNFKSGFFSLAEEQIDGKDVVIQPVAIVYKGIRGMPIDRSQWPDIAWYGDMDLVPHLWGFLKLSCIDVELAFLEPVTLSKFDDRKGLAKHCQRKIADYLEASRGKALMTRRQKSRFSLPFKRSGSQS